MSKQAPEHGINLISENVAQLLAGDFIGSEIAFADEIAAAFKLPFSVRSSAKMEFMNPQNDTPSLLSGSATGNGICPLQSRSGKKASSGSGRPVPAFFPKRGSWKAAAVGLRKTRGWL